MTIIPRKYKCNFCGKKQIAAYSHGLRFCGEGLQEHAPEVTNAHLCSRCMSAITQVGLSQGAEEDPAESDPPKEPVAALNWQPTTTPVTDFTVESIHPGAGFYRLSWHKRAWIAAIGGVEIKCGLLDDCMAACKAIEKSPDKIPQKGN